MPQTYYVYQFRLENSENPFYIGKGRGRRITDHFRPSSLVRRSHKNNVINKSKRDGVSVLSEILFDGLTEPEAHAKEVEVIAFYGRRANGGCLTNATDGGEGVSGYKPTPETMEKIAAKKRGMPLSDDHKKKISSALIGRVMSKESVEKTASANRGKKRSPEQIENSSKALRGVKRKQDTKTAMSIARKGKTKSAIHIAAMTYAAWNKNPAWMIADAVFREWVIRGKPGRPTMQKCFSDFSIALIYRKISNGWIPESDKTWLEYASKGNINVGL